MNNLIYSDLQYNRAFKEVLVILEYIPKTDYTKIPFEIIQVLKDNADNSYNFQLNLKENIRNQNISEISKAIIENFYRDYWVTEIEKRKIIKEEDFKRKKIEEEKRKKYNPNEIFKYNSSLNDFKKSNDINSESMIEIKKENLINKILLFIKKFFNK